MVDNLTRDVRKKTMRAVKGKSTRIEKRLFALLASAGIRGWKKNVVAIRGKPDIAFTEHRVAIFIDGCFWHGCPVCAKKLPQTNRRYWKRKIKRNIEIAEFTNRHLRRRGWRVVRVWGHDVERGDGATKILDRIHRILLVRENTRGIFSSSQDKK
ncbi:MAG: DNA mismatch endonuclease Vsr [Ignavibacteriae bacterium]|nr:DNA mismatch endonuclease Vsr [Ignavibacteriota bacterium]